jgi:hypothetical protein
MARDVFKNASGVEFSNAAAKTFTIDNDTPDRAFDADTVAVAELADIVATLIKDLEALFPGNFITTTS